MKDDVPGYYAPVRRSLTAPMLVAGVPPKVAVCLGMAAGVFVGAWHVYLLLPVIAVAYLVAVAVCKKDPYAFDVILQNRGQGRYVP